MLWYEHVDNTYSEGPKMLYWNVPFDVDGNGSTGDPYDSFANHEFSQLYTYKEDPLTFKPEGAVTRLHIGPDLHIPDHGVTGKPQSGSTPISAETREQWSILCSTMERRRSPSSSDSVISGKRWGCPLLPCLMAQFPISGQCGGTVPPLSDRSGDAEKVERSES